MNLPFFIARRLSHSTTTTSSRVMVRIAIISIALSVAVMIIAIGIVSGFKKELTDKVRGFAADVQITFRSPDNPSMIEPFAADTLKLEHIPGIKRIEPYATANGLMQTSAGVEGVMFKGYDSDYDWSFFENSLLDGEIPQFTDSTRSREVLISSTLARKMGIEVGDIFKFIVINENPRRDRFRVSGIYETGLVEFDSKLIIADLNTVIRINGWQEGSAEGLQITTDGRMQTADEIFQEMPMGRWNLNVAEDTYSQFFEWIKMMELNTSFVLIIMLVVATINMLSGVLVLVLESVSMVGVLKTQGITMAKLQLIFLYRSGYIILWGLFWGNLLGLSLCGAQHYFQLLALDPEAYLLNVVPVWITPYEILMINFGTFAIITLLMSIPTMIVAKIDPADSVKYS